MDSKSKPKCRYCLSDPATLPCLDGIKCCNKLVICDTCEKERAEVGETIQCMTFHNVLRPPTKEALKRRANEELARLSLEEPDEELEELPERIEILRELRNIILLEYLLEQLMIENVQEEKQETWTCTRCTFINSSDTIHCTMCSTEREGLPRWTCSQCTYENAPAINACSICGMPRPDE